MGSGGRAFATWTVLAVWLLGGQAIASGSEGSPAASASDAPVLDRVVAVIEGELLTQSQLELEARISLIQRGGVGAATGPLDDSALGSALDLCIAQRLQTREADRLNAFQVDPAEVESALSAFRERFPTRSDFDAFLSRFETDASGVSVVLARSLRAEKILDSKVRLRAQVSESEVRNAFEERRAGGELRGTYEEVRALLKEQLYRENYQRLARAELDQLQRTAFIRRIAPYARRPERAP